MTSVSDAIQAGNRILNRLKPISIVAQTALLDISKRTGFRARFEIARTLFDEFNKISSQIQYGPEKTELLDSLDSVTTEIDELFYTINSVFLDIQDTTPESSSHCNVRLPRIELPSFSGSQKDWPAYIALFKEVVHENRTLSNIERFHYLLSTLSKEPLNLIKHLPITDANYDIAFNNLTKRYENKRVLAAHYWNAIVHASRLTTESAQALRKLSNTLNENVAALKCFNLDLWDFTLLNLTLEKLDPETRKRFELEHSQVEIPSFSQLDIFIQNQCKVFECSYLSQDISKAKLSLYRQPVAFSNAKPAFKLNPSPSSFVVSASTHQLTCVCCGGDHSIYKCPTFLSKNTSERFAFVKTQNLCINCLGSLHKLKNCASKSTCQKCHSRHHSLIHFERNKPESSVVSTNVKFQQEVNDPTSSSVNALTNTFQSFSKGTVLLATVIIDVIDRFGCAQKLRALLDGASQACFISECAVQKLGLPRHVLNVPIQGLNETWCHETKGITSCTIRPTKESHPEFKIDAIILPKICAPMPSSELSTVGWDHISNLKLADPQFNVPDAVDLLLGAEIFPLILRSGFLRGNASMPTAINTIFGWIVMGKVGIDKLTQINSFCTSVTSIDKTLKQFWQLEEVPTVSKPSAEDVACEKIFDNLHFRNNSGRYVVPLPFKTTNLNFGDSRSIAERRFFSLERRFNHNADLRDSYITFMKDYLDSGHMELISDDLEKNSGYYIPHHAVVNPNSETTKLRVVFDASAKTDLGISLNDALHIGPKLQNDVCKILLHFRLPAIVFTADIKQMYRQILVLPSHRKFQRILWRFSAEEKLREYQLNTVTYGISSAPYLALRTLKQLSTDEGRNFPLAAKALENDIYVDDVVTGSNSVETALRIQRELISLLHTSGLALRKWSSNHPALLDSIPVEDRQTLLDFDDQEATIKILGLRWLPTNDQFAYRVNINQDRPCTKRTILSALARIFDPLGFLSPVTFFAKHLMQQLWIVGLDWDADPPAAIVDRWKQFQLELSALHSFKIERYMQSWACEVHGFSDASERGYAAVVYLRALIDSTQINTYLVIAKSKVAPLKRISVPRLELCAALLLSNLLHYVVEVYAKRLDLRKVYAWTDSTIVLSWIHSSSHEWKPFVGNRISQIHDYTTPSIWHHVRSQDNPADCASRGLLPQEFVDHKLWIHGPPWLTQPADNWPVLPLLERSPEVLAERRTTVLIANASELNSLDTLLHRFSSLQKILRIIAYNFRFFHRIRFKEHKFSGPFTEIELYDALVAIVRFVQASAFKEDITRLQKNATCSKPLRRLCPFLDERGLLRVGGRLRHANLNLDAKHQLLLPRQHRMTSLIIEDCHVQNLHSGLRTTHFLLSQRFWILSAKRAIRNSLSQCYRCFRLNPKPLTPQMGNLPTSRITQAKPFHHVGVDFGGPFIITMGKHRGAKTSKAYLCLFICYATKALHLELVSDLSSEAFLASLRRFIARRGRCLCLHSDCGTNFVGAYRELNELMQNAAGTERIAWNFNPPSSPHFGGLWEAGIKSVKSHLARVVGEQVLTYEELYTVLVQIEALLNSRPLCAMSDDPNDLSVLTPGHFLTLEPLCAPPDSDLTHLSINRLSRWQLLQRMQQDFWKRWHIEFLHTLQQRNKWATSNNPIAINQIVVLKQDSPPLKWPLGRIVQIHPGTDGIARVVTLKTANGLSTRALVKVCPLPSQ